MHKKFLPTPSFSNSMKASEIEEGWSGLLERIHWPLPLCENLIARYPTVEPLGMKVETSSLYKMRPDEPRKEGRPALLEVARNHRQGKSGGGQDKKFLESLVSIKSKGRTRSGRPLRPIKMSKRSVPTSLRTPLRNRSFPENQRQPRARPRRPMRHDPIRAWKCLPARSLSPRHRPF